VKEEEFITQKTQRGATNWKFAGKKIQKQPKKEPDEYGRIKNGAKCPPTTKGGGVGCL